MPRSSASRPSPLRLRLFHYVVLQAIDAWCALVAGPGGGRHQNPVDSSILPLAVGLATVDLVRMGYPVRTRVDFLNPEARGGFPLLECHDLHPTMELLADAGLVLRPDSYFPIHHLSFDGDSRLKELQAVATRSYMYLSEEAPRWYFEASLGLGYERTLRAAPPQETLRHWVTAVAVAGERQRRQLLLDSALQAYREGDWTGDFTFDPFYARLSVSAREYHAVVGSAMEA